MRGLGEVNYVTLPQDALDKLKHDKRFIAACHAMQSFLMEEYYGKMDEHTIFTAKRAVQYADALIKELEK